MDTSVFGGYFDAEFELWTKILFEKINKFEYKVIYSRLTDIELISAPEKVRELAKSIHPNSIEFIDISMDATQLAETYLQEKVVGKTSRADCIHIALATLHNAAYFGKLEF